MDWSHPVGRRCYLQGECVSKTRRCCVLISHTWATGPHTRNVNGDGRRRYSHFGKLGSHCYSKQSQGLWIFKIHFESLLRGQCQQLSLKPPPMKWKAANPVACWATDTALNVGRVITTSCQLGPHPTPAPRGQPTNNVLAHCSNVSCSQLAGACFQLLNISNDLMESADIRQVVHPWWRGREACTRGTAYYL